MPLAQCLPACSTPVCAPERGRGVPCAARAQLGEALVWSAAAAFAVRAGEIRARTRRCAEAAFARQAAMYLAHIGFGLSYREAGRLFGRGRTTAAHACQVMEDRRDDPFVDAMLGALEDACYQLRKRAQRRRRGRS